MSAIIVALDGWNSVVGWSESPWGSGRIALSEAVGGVGSVNVSSPAVLVTGVAGTGDVGSVDVAVGVAFPVTGVAGTGSVGSVSVSISIPVSVTGVSSTGAVGLVTVALGCNVSVTGVSGTGAVGSVLIWNEIIPSQNPNWVLIAA